MQFKICEFWTLFQFFVYDHGPGARAPHIANDFFLQIRSPNKYIGKVDKRWFIRYNGFCARYKNVPGGALRAPPLPWIGLRWTDTGSRIMAAILFLITYQNIQKWFKTYQICAVNNFLSHFGQISARGDKIFENSN